MRTLKLQMQTSVDGFVAGPNGEMDWMTWDWDKRLNDRVTALHQRVDTIVLGRKLYEGFVPAWEERVAKPEADWFTHLMVDTPKIVFSRTLKEVKGKNTALATSELVETISRLKAAPGGDIVAYGGATFVSELIKHGLLDELHLFINPAAIGAGLSDFSRTGRTIPMKLAGSESYDCGIVVNSYTR